VNLVVVSNRVARGKANEPMTGGLAAALLPVVEKSGAIWVGSSGRVRDGAQKEPFAEIEALGAGALAMLDLPAAHYGGYYEGFANSALWPALHSRTDLIRASQDDYLSYREVNAFMARRCCASRSRRPRSGSRIIISWRWARNCAISASPSRSASSCIRRGRRAR
jgi:trehalose 6-phosphate synthase